MPTLSERANLAADPVFVSRVRQAAENYALYILPNPDTDDADIRMAKSFIGDPDRWARVYAIAAAQEGDALNGLEADPAADTDAGDAALAYAVEARIWPAFARETSQ